MKDCQCPLQSADDRPILLKEKSLNILGNSRARVSIKIATKVFSDSLHYLVCGRVARGEWNNRNISLGDFFWKVK